MCISTAVMSAALRFETLYRPVLFSYGQDTASITVSKSQLGCILSDLGQEIKKTGQNPLILSAISAMSR